MNCLFVCTEALHRSPTAARVFSGLAKARRVVVNVKYAGIDASCRHPISKTLLRWADRIYVMEQPHALWLVGMDPSCAAKVRVLDIEDVYRRDEPGLIEILKEKLEKELPPKQKKRT